MAVVLHVIGSTRRYSWGRDDDGNAYVTAPGMHRQATGFWSKPPPPKNAEWRRATPEDRPLTTLGDRPVIETVLLVRCTCDRFDVPHLRPTRPHA